MILTLPPIDPLDAALGERVRRVREARGLSQKELAEAMGLSRERLALAERGRQRLDSSALHRATLKLRVPTRLLFDQADLSALRPL